MEGMRLIASLTFWRAACVVLLLMGVLTGVVGPFGSRPATVLARARGLRQQDAQTTNAELSASAEKSSSKSGKKSVGKTAATKKTAAKTKTSARKKSSAKTSTTKNADIEATALPAAKTSKGVSRKSRKSTAESAATAGDEAARSAASRTTSSTRRTTSSASRRKGSAKSARLRQVFVASAELRPMAQQLATMRTPASYAAVTAYAQRQTGEVAAAAYLALGHAYLLDKRYADATANLRQARQAGDALADYADFLAAQAEHESGNEHAAEALLAGFAQRYPDSIFNLQAVELEARVLLASNDPNGARRVLAANPAGASRTGYQLARAEMEKATGDGQGAERDFKRLLMTHPLSSDAVVARARMTAMGADQNFTASELRTLGDAYYNAGHYAQAAEQYNLLAHKSSADDSTRNGYAVAEAACDLKLKRLTQAEAEALLPTKDENGARRLYLLMELARNRMDLITQRRYVDQLKLEFPQSEWLAEALFSSGNMYLLRRENLTAIADYAYLAAHFSKNKNAAPAHWRAGWLSYRQGLLAQAAQIFDEQIRLYPGAKETVSALYWRGRLYETLDHQPNVAAANYRTLTRVYPHFFYAQMARQRLVALGKIEPAPQSQLESFVPAPAPHLDTDFPDSPHLAKARLLANAGLSDYISMEIAAAPGSGSWSALAEARIYDALGDPYRALRALKRAVPGATSAEIRSIPLPYWRILFPEPWWETIQAESAKNNLDPYLVASLIRQESEFNPSVVSHANAYGLMQMLPSVGKAMAHEEGIKHFETFQLLNPEMNIRLGTRYLRETLAHFGGVKEYALAAYNAGNERVSEWQGTATYSGIDEFVESIPFTETREYVQAIVRNREIYQSIDDYDARQRRDTPQPAP